MEIPFIGTEAVGLGLVTPYELRSRFVTVYPGIYITRDAEVTARLRAEAAYLWSARRGILAGRSAAVLHGAKWVDAQAPAEMIYDNRHTPPDVRTWHAAIADDEIATVGGMRVTTSARTALDIARRYELDAAVAAIDALANATELKTADVEPLMERYRGRPGMRLAEAALKLVDAGAESPRETELRLLLIRAGFPPPQTQIRVVNEFGQFVARVDMGWANLLVAVEYDGDHHWKSRRRLAYDIRRAEALRELGWIVIRVTAEDTPATIIRRVAAARAQRLARRA